MIKSVRKKQPRKENRQTIPSKQAKQNQMHEKATISKICKGPHFIFVKNYWD
jgi:hypothetical protein